MDMLSFGLIGCGPMGQRLVEALAKIPGTRLAAVSDPLEEPRQQVAEAHGAEGHADYADLLARPDLGAVIVATPSGVHKEASVAAMRAGKDVFCEKPMALNLADCDAMIRTAAQTGRKLMIGHVLRLMFPWARIKELAGEAELGAPCCVDISRYGPWGMKGWRARRETSGGPLFEVNVHELDLMRHLCGEVAQVSAYGGRFQRLDLDFNDTYLINVRFRNGSVGRLRGGCSGAVNRYVGEVICERGTVSWGPGWGETWVHRPEAEPERLDPEQWSRPPGLEWELGSFTSWVQRGEPPIVTAADGRAAVELAVAANESIEQGRPVDL